MPWSGRALGSGLAWWISWLLIMMVGICEWDGRDTFPFDSKFIFLYRLKMAEFWWNIFISESKIRSFVAVKLATSSDYITSITNEDFDFQDCLDSLVTR